MKRRDLVAAWSRQLAAIEAEYALVEAGTSVLSAREVGRLEGMIVVYRKLLADAA